MALLLRLSRPLCFAQQQVERKQAERGFISMIQAAFLHDKNSYKHSRHITASRGFTLIELMIVVAIIAIILTLALPVYSDYSIRAKIAEALSVSKAAKTAISMTCQEDPTIAALTPQNSGYTFAAQSKYVASITLSGPCTLPVITIVTQRTGAFPDPSLTVTGTMGNGQMDFVCVSTGPNKYLPRTCRS